MVQNLTKYNHQLDKLKTKLLVTFLKQKKKYFCDQRNTLAIDELDPGRLVKNNGTKLFTIFSHTVSHMQVMENKMDRKKPI